MNENELAAILGGTAEKVIYGREYCGDVEDWADGYAPGAEWGTCWASARYAGGVTITHFAYYSCVPGAPGTFKTTAEGIDPRDLLEIKRDGVPVVVIGGDGEPMRAGDLVHFFRDLAPLDIQRIDYADIFD